MLRTQITTTYFGAALLLPTTLVGCAVELDSDVSTLEQELGCIAGAPKPTTAWKVSVSYAKGARVTYQGIVYDALVAHRSQTGWEPTKATNLWVRPTPCDGEPWAVQTNYVVGTKAVYSGKTYQCLQAHVSQSGWNPAATPALWKVTSGGTAPTKNHQVDAFIFRHMQTCVIGHACTSGQCFNFESVTSPKTVEKKFQWDSAFAVVRPEDAQNLGSGMQVQCLNLKINDAEALRLRNELEATRNFVLSHTQGNESLNFVVHDIAGPTPMTMQPVVGPATRGIALTPLDLKQNNIVQSRLTKNTDFTFGVVAMGDTAAGPKGMSVPLGGCGLAYGFQGLAGAGYSFHPQTGQYHGFECATAIASFVHEWLHQVDEALAGPSSFNDIYQDVAYPGCGAGDPDPKKWFPNPDTACVDPDAPYCNPTNACMNATITDEVVLSHLLDAHWDPNRPFFPNHCKNGKQDAQSPFDETGIDVGPNCLP